MKPILNIFICIAIFLIGHSVVRAIDIESSPAFTVTPNNFQWGQSATWSLRVANRDSSTETAQLIVYLSKSPTVDASSYNIGFTNPTAYPPNGYEDWSRTFPTPTEVPTGFASGTNYIVAVVYLNGTAAATSVVAVTMTANLPDLIGRQTQATYNGSLYNFDFSVQQSSVVWGQTEGFQFAVLNQGGQPTNGPFKVRFFLSETNSFGTGNSPNSSGMYEIIPAATVPSSQSSLPDGSFAYSVNGLGNPGYFSFTLPSTNPFGDSNTHFYLGMVINPTGDPSNPAIPESNYGNNCNQGIYIDSVPITIAPSSSNQPSLSAFGSNPVGSSSQLNFGSINADGPGGAMATQTIVLSNTGYTNLNINNIAINSVGTAAGFKITSITSNAQTLPGPMTYPQSISPNAVEDWTVTVTYDPTAAGAQSGTLTITSNDPTTPTLNYTLSGTGVAVPHLAFTNPVPSNNNNLIANFGTILQSTAQTETFTLTNPGTQNLTINANGIQLTDTQSGVWSIVSISSNTQPSISVSSVASSGQVIAPNNSETWTVVAKFLPTSNVAYATNLEIFSNDPLTPSSSPTISCLFQGQGVIPIPVTVTSQVNGVNDSNPLVMNFGSTQASGLQQVPGTITLINTGTSALNIIQNGVVLGSTGAFQITGISSSLQGAVNLTQAGSTIAPNSSETWTISVVFNPLASGALSTQLTVSSSNPGQATINVALSGTGLSQPAILVTTPQGGTTLPFGPVLNDGAGNHISMQTFTIQDVGLQQLTIAAGGITLSGSSAYSIQGITSSLHGAVTLPATIAAQGAETLTVTVGFDPTANTSYSGTLTIASNSTQNSSLALSLTGSGTIPSLTLNPTSTSIAALYVQAGQIYSLTWTASDTADTATTATLTLSYSSSNNVPATGLTTIATLPFNQTTGSYAWRPSPSLVGQEVYLYGSLQDTGLSSNSFSAQKIHIEPAGSFNLLSALITTTSNYTYQYIYNGQVYSGTTTLQSGPNTINITTPLSGGGSAVHQITVTKVTSLLASQSYTYDEMNRPKTLTNGNGITTTYTYDFAGDLTKTSASNGNVVTYTYDNLKRRTSMTDSTGTTFYDYDDLDRLSNLTYSIDNTKGNSDDLVVHYEYDNASHVIDMTYPGGEHIHFTYDNAGRLTGANNITNNQNNSYNYDYTTGLLHTVVRSNGVTTTYSYDSVGRLTDIKHQKGSTVLAEYNYTLDSNGNVTSLLTTYADGSQKQNKYTYDGLKHLVQVVYGSSATASVNDKTVIYAYDGVGNRQTQTTKVNNAVTQVLTYSYGDQNRLVSIVDQNNSQVASYSYDAAGNRIQKVTPSGNTYYTYDERNLLTSILSPTDYITYSYAGDGQRVAKTIDGVTTQLINVNHGLSQTIQERSNGSIVQSYTFGLDRLICNQVSGGPEFFLPDRLGSSRQITDGSGNVTATNDYDAFGAPQ